MLVGAALILSEFRASVLQCDRLIANAHQAGPTGQPFLPTIDRQQITIAAFLNMFIAWESFLETSLAEFMTGGRTISGQAPIRYVVPRTVKEAQAIVIGIMRYFDYANHENFKKMARLYFDAGYPYEPHLSGIASDLADLKTLRNASAHTTSTTQNALETLALRIFGQPQSGITLYQTLTNVDPRSGTNDTAFLAYKNKLLVAAELISNG